MDIQQMFQEKMIEAISGEIGEKIGLDKGTTQTALGKALPMILGQISKNTKTEEGKEALDKALDKGHNTPEIKLDLEDGGKILAHIMGGKSDALQNTIKKAANIDDAKSNDLLKLASSFVMENLGKAKNEGNLSKSNMGPMLGLASKFLDKDNDGDIKDDILSMIFKYIKNMFSGRK